MPEYKTVMVGNVSDKWTKKGQEKEMAQLSAAVNAGDRAAGCCTRSNRFRFSGA